MASVLDAFWHFGSGGLEEAGTTSGSPSVQSTIKKSGDYALKLTGASTEALASVNTSYSPPDTVTLLFWARFTDISPATQYPFFWYGSVDDPTNVPHFTVELQTDGDIEVLSADSGSVITISAPLTADTWHFFRIDFKKGNAPDGKMRVLVDGAGGEAENIDTNRLYNGMGFAGPSAASDGDVYIDCFARWSTTEWKPTDIPDDIAVSTSYQTGDTTATDLGDTLDSGTWDNTAELPFSDTNIVEINTSNAEAGTDADGGGAYPDGTVLGGYGAFYMDRTNGSSSTFTIYAGNSGDTWFTGLQTATPTLTVVPTYQKVKLTAAQCPSSGEYFRLGFGKTTGGRDPQIIDCFGILLYEPTVAGGGMQVMVVT